MSYALVPSEDFQKVSKLLETGYGVQCTKKDKAADAAQVDPSDCSCKDYSSLPALKMKIFADKSDQAGQWFSMPRETYIKD